MSEKLSIEAELAQGDAKVKEIAKTAKQPVAVAPEPAQEAEEVSDQEEAAQEAQAPVEAPEAEEPAEEPEEEADRRFSVLAEREVKLRNLERDIKTKEANLGKSVDQLRKEVLADLKRNLEEDPQGFWDEMGAKYEEVSKKMLEKRPDPTALRLKREVGELQKRIEEQDRQKAEQERKRLYDAALAETRSFIETSEAHPRVRAAGMHNEVLEVIQVHYSETGQELSYDAAADKVEAYLTDLEDKLTASRPSKAKTKAAPEQRPAKTASQTLKNKQAAVPARGSGPEELLSRDESIARAGKLIKFLPKE